MFKRMFAWLKKHNLFIWILSLFISIMLWAYVAVVQDPEITMSISGIPVVFGDEEKQLAPRELMILSGKDTALEIRFTGRRSDLAKIKRENVVLNVDLSSVRNAGPASCAYTVTLPSGLESVKVEKRRDYVDITVDSIREKPVPIRLDRSEVTAADTYSAETETLEPETLVLTGPSSVLDTISYALVKVSKTGATKKIEQIADFTLHTDTGELVRSPYVTSDAENGVRVTIPVVMLKEVHFKLAFIDGGGLTEEKNITWSVEPKYIVLSGDPSILEGINTITLETVDLSKLIDSMTKELDVTLPNDVKNVSNLTTVKATINIIGVDKRVINATDITVTGASPPEGYHLVIETKEVPITLRGPKETLDLISPHSVRIVADMSGVSQTPGYHIVTAKAYLDGFTSVGIVGGNFEVRVNIVPDIPDDGAA